MASRRTHDGFEDRTTFKGSYVHTGTHPGLSPTLKANSSYYMSARAGKLGNRRSGAGTTTNFAGAGSQLFFLAALARQAGSNSYARPEWGSIHDRKDLGGEYIGYAMHTMPA
jgi:hypothetical protein